MNINYDRIPEHCRESLKRYVETGCPVGDFLTAVLCNSLVDAFARADDINARHMRQYACWLYNQAPGPCWRSQEKVKKWIELGGMKGWEENGHTTDS